MPRSSNNSKPNATHLHNISRNYNKPVWINIATRRGRIFTLIRPVSSVVMSIDAGGLRFKSRIGQIGYSIANGSPPVRRFFGAVCTGVKPRRWAPPLSCYTFWRNAAIAIKNVFVDKSSKKYTLKRTNILFFLRELLLSVQTKAKFYAAIAKGFGKFESTGHIVAFLHVKNCGITKAIGCITKLLSVVRQMT